jgi:molybdate transport system ATP-binding protein
MQARLVPPKDEIGYVSFELHQGLMEYEALQEDLREYAGKKDEGTTAQDVMFSGILANRAVRVEDEERLVDVVDRLGIRECLSRSIASLSTGEIRKTLIARALMKSPKLLILDEPFDGLDGRSRATLAESVNTLMTGSMRVILVVHRLEEIVPNITHVLLVKSGQLFQQGLKHELLTSENISTLYGFDLHLEKTNDEYHVSYGAEKRDLFETTVLSREVRQDVPEVLIEMKDTTVRYRDLLVLDHLNWSMKQGENWAILGPNGSGKSTIVKLILGDNLQGYANQVMLFGRRKGSGETLGEIKKHLGVVSSELQVHYRKKMSAYDVIASGFYDSIGLYHFPTPKQKTAVDEWIELLKIGDIAKEAYHQLSYGQKRMILLARAMVKSPALLIVDEPCHGLDIPNRKRILDVLERIGRTQTNLLYVTNHKDEILNCITHVMRLKKGKVLKQGPKKDVL